LVLIKKVSGENFTGKILTAKLLTSQAKCVIPSEARDLIGLIMNAYKMSSLVGACDEAILLIILKFVFP